MQGEYYRRAIEGNHFTLIVTTTKTAHVCASVFVFSLFPWNNAGLSWKPNFKRWNVGKLTMMRAATLSRRDRRRRCDRPTWRKSRQREKPLVWGEKANSPLLLTCIAFFSANSVAICLRWVFKKTVLLIRIAFFSANSVAICLRWENKQTILFF